jgi:MOSC domain-containing protein YiiM
LSALFVPAQRAASGPGSRLLSVNVGVVEDLAGARPSGIRKRAVDGPVRIGPLGLEGDEQADRRHHGGADKAVYAYAAEALDSWAAILERPLWPGAFGENLTTERLDVDGARIGEIWRIGTARLQVRGPRTPCRKLTVALDRPSLQREFLAAGRPGAYLGVLEPGEVRPGDEIVVESRPADAPTVAEVFRQTTGRLPAASARVLRRVPVRAKVFHPATR